MNDGLVLPRNFPIFSYGMILNGRTFNKDCLLDESCSFEAFQVGVAGYELG
jgi:hypothetical protein